MNRPLFLIKLFHTLVFLFMSACILYIVAAGLTRTYDWKLAVAFGAITLEGIVYFGNGRRCPLTDLALRYGDQTGNDLLADIFLPDWAARKIFPVSSVILLISIVLLIGRYFLG
ncbi:MAG TPA: hypothetical protein VHO69_05200 [Phototrophicaceae bacterium]|nr:hypothetical protein [Phototrophicaceae bacterium]